MSHDTYVAECDEMRDRLKAYTENALYQPKNSSEIAAVGNPYSVGDSIFSRNRRYVPHDDKPPHQSHTQDMSNISREEFNAKLEVIESRMDARAESVSAKIDAFLAVQSERDQRFNEKLNSSITLSDEWNQKFRMLAEQSVQAAASADASAREAATLKTHFWASVAAQVLAVGAIVVGAYFANQANVLSAISTTVSVFQAGKDTGKTPEQPPTKTE